MFLKQGQLFRFEDKSGLLLLEVIKVIDNNGNCLLYDHVNDNYLYRDASDLRHFAKPTKSEILLYKKNESAQDILARYINGITISTGAGGVGNTGDVVLVTGSSSGSNGIYVCTGVGGGGSGNRGNISWKRITAGNEETD